MNFSLKAKHNKNSTFLSLLFLVGVPALISITAVIVVLIVNFYSIKATLKNSTISYLSQLSQYGETQISSVVNTVQFIEEVPELRKALEDPNAVFDESLSTLLRRFKTKYSFLDKIYILNQKKALVCTESGIYSTKDFFASEYKYEGYDLFYWNTLRFWDTNDYRILSPVIVTANKDSKVVIPIVFRRTQNLSMKNLLVFNADFSLLMTNEKSPGISSDAPVYLMNKYTNEIFSPKTNEDVEFSDDFKKQLFSGTNRTFDYKLNGKKVIVNMYSPDRSLSSYTYFSLTPKSTVMHKMLPTIAISLLLAFLIIFIAAIAAFFSTKSIFNPMKKMHSAFSNDKISGSAQDIFKNITAYAQNIKEQNQNLSSVLPCAQEQYLISYLNSIEHYIDSHMQDILKASLLFKYDLFAIVIIQLSPTNLMFDYFNNAEYTNIRRSFYDIVKELFNEDFHSFVLPGDSETQYIILNFEASEDLSKAEKTLGTIYALLKNDMEYINLSIGKSGIHTGFEGLKKAHVEATESLTLHPANSGKIALKNSCETEFSFDSKVESAFLTAMLACKKEKVFEIFNSVIKENAGLNDRAQKQVYNYILNIVLKTIRIKKLPYQENRLDFEILNELLELPPEELHKKTVGLINYTLSAGENLSPRGNDASNVIEYIDKNFALSALSLDYLADYFHISQSNLSVIIKNSLGIGFHEYLTNLRVNKAKAMLSETSKKISTIHKECGFSNEQTFYRTFKKLTGQTPSEYRKTNILK